MKVTTWNINGVKARLESAVAYLKQASPDVICLQEIKSVTEGFPREAFEELGYHCAIHGQRVSTASPSCRSCRWRSCAPAFPATTPTTSPASSRRSSRCRPVC
jgi:hypothetical protein